MTFSTTQAAKAAQVTLRQLQWWDERKIVSPAHEGHARVYDEQTFFKVLLVAKLRAKGISLQRVRAALRSLPLEKLMDQTDAVMIMRRKGMRICNEEAAVRALDLENGPVAVVLIAPLLAILKKQTPIPRPERKAAKQTKARDRRRAVQGLPAAFWMNGTAL